MYKPVRLDARGRVVRLGAQGKAEQRLGRAERLGGVERERQQSFVEWQSFWVFPLQNYTKEDELHGLLLWHLGGRRVADIVHQALGLPSLSTLCCQTLIPRLTPSSGPPTLEEVVSNTVACTSIIEDVLKTSHIVHQVLMFDEIKVEEQPRWDDKSNNIIRVCREHSKNTSLQYTSKDEVDLLFSQIIDEKVHLASNVCF